MFVTGILKHQDDAALDLEPISGRD